MRQYLFTSPGGTQPAGENERRRQRLGWMLGLGLFACVLTPLAQADKDKGKERHGEREAKEEKKSGEQGQLPKALMERLQLCGGCHGADGNSVIADNPKLAGLDPGYIRKQMLDFKTGQRASLIMAGMISTVKEDEIDGLAAWFGGQKPSPGVVQDANLAAIGKAIFDEGIDATAVPACSGCHNEDGSGTDKFPRLAGQHAAYVVQQMKNFKSGARVNDTREVMRAVAKRMNEKEMIAVAEYIASLKGGEQ